MISIQWYNVAAIKINTAKYLQKYVQIGAVKLCYNDDVLRK